MATMYSNLAVACVCCFGIFAIASTNNDNDAYSYTVTDISGNEVSLEKFRGKVTLFVNVASECGYTDGHYLSMVKISSDPALSDHFTILAFPCNQFGNQEPKTNDLIEKFAKDNYAVNFPMFSKIDIVGDSAHPLFKYLSGVSKKEPTWNFWKFLVDHKGHVINSYGPWISVDSIYPEIIAAVRKARGISHGNEL